MKRNFPPVKSDAIIRNILIKGKDNKSCLRKSGRCLDYVTAWVIIPRVRKLQKQIILHICEQRKNQQSSCFWKVSDWLMCKQNWIVIKRESIAISKLVERASKTWWHFMQLMNSYFTIVKLYNMFNRRHFRISVGVHLYPMISNVPSNIRRQLYCPICLCILCSWSGQKLPKVGRQFPSSASIN